MAEPAENVESLAVRIMRGDELAEAELVAKYERGLRLMLLKRTQDVHLAADLCQDTLVLVLKKLRQGELRNPASLASFIRTIGINLSIQHYRKDSRYVNVEGEINEPNPSLYRSQEGDMDSRLVKNLIHDLLDKLGRDRDRELLRRFFLQDEEKMDICRDLELTSTHFDRVLYRAKSRMRTLIDTLPELKKLLLEGLYDD